MQQHISTYSMNALCEALSVSRSGFHAWCHRPTNQAGLALSQAITTCHVSHKARPGAPGIHADLQAQGICVSVRGFQQTLPILLRQLDI